MISDITEYLSYLASLGLQVSVHFGQKTLPGLPPLSNIHSNPYCLAVKSNQKAWARCIECQKKVLHKCNDGEFYGMCYAGMGEYVFPLLHQSTNFGFVSVSGYCNDRLAAEHRIKAVAKQYHLASETLLPLFHTHTKPTPLEPRWIPTLVHPLCHMLSLLYGQTKFFPEGTMEEDYLYGHLLAYLNDHFGQDMTVERLSQLCHCSVSYVSHLFKQRSGCSISEYKNRLRIKEAKRLLCTTSLSIGEVAERAGFLDSNYFSSLFQKRTGVSPSQYRKESKQSHEKENSQ